MTGWVTAASGAFGIVLVVGVIVAYFRVSLSAATIATLKESNEALTKRNAELDQVIARVEARLEVLERENETLRSALSGKADIDRVVERIEHHHDEVMADRREFEDRFTAAMVTVGEKIDATRKAVGDVLALVGDTRTQEPPS